MNHLGISLAWMALQTGLFCLAGVVAYAIARRCNAAWAAPILCGVLAISIGIAAMSLSPWPRWRITADAAQPTSRANKSGPAAAMISNADAPSASGAPLERVVNATTASIRDSAVEATVFGYLSKLWGDMQRRGAGVENPGADQVSAWRWPAWLAAIMLAGAAIGAARATLGLLALARLLRTTRPVADVSLVHLLEQIRGQLGCLKPIELRETTDPRRAASPAVVGWFRPVILLPADWRLWSVDVRRGILAHEAAHVAHGDFVAGLVAQLGVILHFYNPLVHWFARRLRLEQELAADACGAALTGGAKPYLTMLAQMALEQDRSQPLWAGSPFFPTRGTLMRRIEMLNNPRFTARRSPSRLGTAALFTLLALAGLTASGLRGPAGEVQAADPAAKQASAEQHDAALSDGALPAFDDSYLPADAIAVMTFKPLQIPQSNIILKPELLGFPGVFGFALSATEKEDARGWELDEAKTVVLSPAPRRTPSAESADAAEPPFVILYRMRQPYEASKLRKRVFGEAPDGVTESIRHGRTCFSAASESSGDVISFLLVDDRTIVVARERDMPRLCSPASRGRPSWYDEWQAIAGSPLALAFDAQPMAAVDTDPSDEIFWSVLKQSSLFFGRVDATPEGLEIGAIAHCASTDQAQATAELAKGALAAAIKAIPPLLKSTDLPQEFQGLDLAAAIVQTLSRLDANVQEERVRFATRFDADFATRFADATRAILMRQEEEHKTNQAQAKQIEERHMANLGRLATAMNAYHDEHGHYPPSAVAGPDGKTVHSWRVELLPYLGEQELFASYKLDEPWDSEHNKQLIAKAPQIYGAMDRAQPGNADYFVVTGKGTLFDRDALPTRGSVADAAAETILLVQCPYQWTPWTRPEDIDYSADDKPPRPFRGRGEAFYAAFVDGTVRFVPRRVDPSAVRPLLTKAAGDEVKLR